MHWTGLPVPGRHWHLCQCGSSATLCGVPWGQAHCRWIHCPGSHWIAAASAREGASRRLCLAGACLVPVFLRPPLPSPLRVQTATDVQGLILDAFLFLRHNAASQRAVRQCLLRSHRLFAQKALQLDSSPITCGGGEVTSCFRCFSAASLAAASA